MARPLISLFSSFVLVLAGCGGGEAVEQDGAESNLEQQSGQSRLTKASVWGYAVDADRIFWGEGMGSNVRLFSRRIDGSDTAVKLWESDQNNTMKIGYTYAMAIADGNVYFIASHRDEPFVSATAPSSAKLWRLPRSGGAPTLVVNLRMIDNRMELAYDAKTKKLYAADFQKVVIISPSEGKVVQEVAREKACNRLLLDEQGDAVCLPEADFFNDFYSADLRADSPAFKRVVTTGPTLDSGPTTVRAGRVYASVRDPGRGPLEVPAHDSFAAFDAKTGATLHTGAAAPRPLHELSVDRIAAREDGSACSVSGSLYCRIGQAGTFKTVATSNDLAFEVVSRVTIEGSRVVTAGEHGLTVTSVSGL
jgi:hypothetical protein